MHDTVFAATYIVRAFLRCAFLADSISYWTFTDVFEEGGAGIGPFHGGFGLVNEQGIHKPTFHALAMLSHLGDHLLMSTDDGVITRHGATGALAAVFFNYPADMGTRAVGSEITYEATRALASAGPNRRIHHVIDGVSPGASFRVESLDWDHGNVAEAWHQLGAPVNLTPAQTAGLARVADALRVQTLTASASGTLEIDLDLPGWAVTSIVQIS